MLHLTSITDAPKGGLNLPNETGLTHDQLVATYRAAVADADGNAVLQRALTFRLNSLLAAKDHR